MTNWLRIHAFSYCQFNMSMRLLLLVATYLGLVTSYEPYQQRIPNGRNVPHPCKPNFIWYGVGHKNVLGSGEKNPFGRDFITQGKNWTEELCNMDSDGDGLTNGQELGDPNCTWTKGLVPSETLELSHPGVCEPTESERCISINNGEIDCSEGEDFACDGLDDPETVNVTLRFDKVQVPAQETTYICQAFDIPDDREYHLFASKPEIDNRNVMHHLIVYGCPPIDDIGFDTPQPCGMTGGSCYQIITTWVLGQNGDCLLPDTGVLVGKGHYSKVVVQMHWNNPTLTTEYFDSSGITMYLTPNLKTNNVAYFSTGQEELVIPPGKQAYTVNGTCTGDCTAELLQGESIYILSSHLHMHYLGAAGRLEQWRNGELITTWFSEESFSYDLPIFNKFDPPVELKPGDEIVTVCTFQSTSKSEITYHGLSTSDEMCYGFMSFYPAEAKFRSCDSRGDYDECQQRQLKAAESSQTTVTVGTTTESPQTTVKASGAAALLPASIVIVTVIMHVV